MNPELCHPRRLFVPDTVSVAQVLTDDMTEAAAAAAADRHPFDEAAGSRIVVRNGALDGTLSDVSSLPEGVFVGSLADAPPEVAAQLVSELAHPTPLTCLA